MATVTLSDGLTYIGASAFAGCTALTSITIPNSVTEINSRAFSSCSALASVVMPEGDFEIDGYAFDNCSALASVTVSEASFNRIYYVFSDTPYYESVSKTENGLKYVGKILVGYDEETVAENITVREDTLKIADEALSGNKKIKSITLNDGLLEIGQEAFYGCENLESIVMPDTVQKIGENILANTKLYSSTVGPLYVGKHLISLNDVTEINVLEGTLTIADKAADAQGNVKTVNIPASVKHIGEDAFYTLFNLTAINVDEANSNYKSVDGVLYDKNLTTLIKCPEGKSGVCIIPETVTEIADCAFMSSADITDIVIPKSVVKIGNEAFVFTGTVKVFYTGSEAEYEAIIYEDGYETTAWRGGTHTLYYSDEWSYVDSLPKAN